MFSVAVYVKQPTSGKGTSGLFYTDSLTILYVDKSNQNTLVVFSWALQEKLALAPCCVKTPILLYLTKKET